MRAKQHLRPHLEALEAVTLLSGVAAAVHHNHAQVAAVTGGGTTTTGATISLTGTQRGFYFSRQQNPDTGTQYNFFATGRVNPVGPALSTGSFTTPGNIATGAVNGTMVLRGRGGTLDLKLTGTAPGFSTGPFFETYDITGGTGKYAGDTGSGPVEITVRPFGSAASARAGFGSITLNFGMFPPTTATT